MLIERNTFLRIVGESVHDYTASHRSLHSFETSLHRFRRERIVILRKLAVVALLLRALELVRAACGWKTFTVTSRRFAGGKDGFYLCFCVLESMN
jgi:hypothetical protein